MDAQKLVNPLVKITFLTATIIGGLLLINQSKKEPMTQYTLDQIQKLQLESRTRGRQEATSNLVSAVNILTERARENILLRVNGFVQDTGISYETREGYLSCGFDIVNQIETLRREMRANAEEYSRGYLPATNSIPYLPKLNIKVNL